MTTAQSGSGPRYDLVVQGGIVLDGTGAEARLADVGIIDERIAAVGDLAQTAAGRRIEVSGKHVSPGFIDIHTHSDISASYDPGQESAIAMGVTTQVVGNCGLSLGLATDTETFAFERRWLAPHGARITWETFAEYLSQVETTGIATNFLPLAGHGSLRKRVMGMEDRPPTPDEMLAMQRELGVALEAGVWGLSSGLEYPPSSYATEDELAELCGVVGRYGGFYATHLRNEGDTLVEAVREAMNVATRAGLPLQLSHHKAEGPRNWGKVQTTLAMVQAARSAGLDVQLDQYPYTAFMTALSIQTLPRWALSGTAEETTARLTDPVQRAAILHEMRDLHPDWEDTSESSPWRQMQIGVCRGRPDLQGRTIAELAGEANREPLEFILDLLVETGGYVSAVNFAISEEDIATVMRHPLTSIGSDGVGTHPGGTAAADLIHPRAYGTFPRVLGRYVRDLQILTYPQAIHKMTGLPATRLGITDRGFVAPGCYADLTVYDPTTVRDVATFADPHRFAEGIDIVIINGRIAHEHGAANSTRPGKVLRHTGRTGTGS